MADLAEGTVFAGHRIEGVAGRGGMGTVYRATHLALDHPVALKVISPELAEDPSFRERFRSESRIAVSLRHPNVVPIHHAGEEGGLLFVTMDLIDGPDVRRLLISRGPLEPRQATGILAQVASALDVAHSRGLVHRDIKPGNILIEERQGSDHAYLTDFGLTKRIDQGGAASGLTSTGAFVGTLDYVAPEQIRGDDLDARTDVYALGCVLYEMLAGAPPFGGYEEKVAKMYAHLQDRPEPLSGAAADLDDVVERAMGKERGDRFPSAGDLARAARAALGGAAPTEAERSVATGPAAPTAAHPGPAPAAPTGADLEPTVESAPPEVDSEPPGGGPTVEAEPPAGAGREPDADPGPGSGLEPEPAVERGRPRGDLVSTGRRWPPLALVGAGLALTAAAVVAVLVLGSGGDDGAGVGTAGTLVEVEEAPVGIDAGAGSVRAATRGNGRLVELEAGGEAEVIDLGVDSAEDVVFSADTWWATAPESDAVVPVGASDEPQDPIGVGSGPTGIAADGETLWVANSGDGTLSRIDAGDQVASVELVDGANPRGLAVAGGEVWVTSRDNDRLIRVDADEPSTQTPFEVGPNPKGVAVVDGVVWVASSGRGGEGGSLWRLEPGAQQPERVDGVDGNPRDVLFAADRLWVSNGDGYVTAVDPEGGEVLGQVGPDGLPGGFSPEDLALGPEGLVWTTSIEPEPGGAVPIEPS